MTPERFRECLAALHWSQRDFSSIVNCGDRLVRRFATGEQPIPASLAAWLETLAVVHECTRRRKAGSGA